ncbi:MAG TPA: ankyrin repeat domain-containing protein, partial [Bryobacteraceae bacterium]
CDGCSETVQLLLAKGADPKAVDGIKGTSLLWAAAGGDVASMRALIAKGSDVNAVDEEGITPLQFAAMNCDAGAERLLLSKGAEVDKANTSAGQVKFGMVQLIHLTPLMLAASLCPAEAVEPLLQAKANVNARDIREMTPLMFAVASDRQTAAAVRRLLKAGADVNAKSKAGETALDWAKKFGQPEVLEALAAAGAKEGAPHAAPKRPATEVRAASGAAEAAVGLVQKSATEFFKQSGCVGCHHQDYALMAAGAARAAGIHYDNAAAKDHVKMIEGQWTGFYPAVLEKFDLGGLTDSVVYSLMGLAAGQYAPNHLTDVLADYVAFYQRQDGSWWLGGTPRSPIEEGRIARTALALRVLQIYAPPARKAEFDQRIARARNYLLEAKALSTDDLAMRAAGLHWAGASAEKVRSASRALVAAQRDDGGWSPNQYLASDAYATGEALWVLKEIGAAAPADATYQRGVKYLLSTQWPDGSWYVRSRAPKFQPYFQSGFPFEHDQWISSSATAWAVMALAPAAGPVKSASR